MTSGAGSYADGPSRSDVDACHCTGPRCPTIPAFATVSVPDSAIIGFTPHASEAWVYWWRATTDSTARLPADSIHHLVAPL